jgi:hypothetical protein
MTAMSTLEPDLSSPVTPAKPPLRKRLLLTGSGLIALVVVGVYASHWWSTGRFLEETDDAYIGGDVTVIGPKVAGYIEEVLVSDNQSVKAGDVLIRLDARLSRQPRQSRRRGRRRGAAGQPRCHRTTAASGDRPGPRRHRCRRRRNRPLAG